jgi:hypothetical protein
MVVEIVMVMVVVMVMVAAVVAFKSKMQPHDGAHMFHTHCSGVYVVALQGNLTQACVSSAS